MPSKIHPVWYAVAIPLAGVIIAVLLVSWRKSAPATVDRFSVEQYCAAPANFMGNAYTVEGQIDAQLAYQQNVGRLISVRLQDGKRIGVFAKPTFKEKLAVGQRYRMDIVIGQDGLITLESITKL